MSYFDQAADLSRARAFQSLQSAQAELDRMLSEAEAARLGAQSACEPQSHFCEREQAAVTHPKSACCCGVLEFPFFENPYDEEAEDAAARELIEGHESEVTLDGHDDGGGLTPDKR